MTAVEGYEMSSTARSASQDIMVASPNVRVAYRKHKLLNRFEIKIIFLDLFMVSVAHLKVSAKRILFLTLPDC